MRRLALIAVLAGCAATPLSLAAQSLAPDSLFDRLIGQWVLTGTIGRRQTTHDVTFQWMLGREYVQMHEVSRERAGDGSPVYQAVVLFGRDPRSGEYACLWMDNTASNAFDAAGFGRGSVAGDSIPFFFRYTATTSFHNTFVYDKASDTWQWRLDNDSAGVRRPFARLSLARSPARDSGAVTKVEIPETQQRRLTNSINGQEYVLYVHLPTGYATATTTYPVLYLLDAQWDFPLVVGLVESLTDDGFVPPVIIVGVTWGGNDPDYGYLRFRDLTPTASPRFPQSGKAADFLRFLKNDVIPRVESDYRATKTDRTLMGNSLGGLFGVYSMFAEPGLFNRYVLSSPNLGFAGGVAPFEQRYASTAKDLPVRLFIDVGDVEGPHIAQLNDFAASLRARHYRGLEFETLIVKSAGHDSNKPEGFVRGLQMVLAPKPLAIADTILDRYVGRYQFSGYTEQVVRDKGQLYLIIPEGTRFVLNPTSEKDFYTRGVYSVVHFNATGMEVEQQGGGRISAAKIP